MQQIANILEQPISLQTSRRKTSKRPYSLVLFIPVGAGKLPALIFAASADACTPHSLAQNTLHSLEAHVCACREPTGGSLAMGREVPPQGHVRPRLARGYYRHHQPAH